MSSYSSAAVVNGFWIDRNLGSVFGATWTIQNRGGDVLQSFTAIFTTFAFTRLWSIVAVVLYYARADRNQHDGLRLQRQVILRNSEPMSSAILFGMQIFYWHSKADRAKRRSAAWMIAAFCFAVASIVASTFTSYATSRASSNRLVSGASCTYPVEVPGPITSDTLLQYTLATVNDTVNAANYARNCYGGDPNSARACRRYARLQLDWTAEYDTSCPFQSGICSNGDNAAFTLTSQKLDSLTDLGINTPKAHRLVLQKKMTCSSIREVDYYSQTGSLVYYNFGSINTVSNYTFVYNRLAEAALVSYSLASRYSYAGWPSLWSPIQALNRTDADVSIIFISSNTVVYAYPNEDPVFSATQSNGQVYESDYDVSTVACAEQYQVCNPASRSATDCSPWMGAVQLQLQTVYLESSSDFIDQQLWQKDEAQLSSTQLAVLQRIAFILPQTSTYNAIATRRASALRLQDSLFEFIQTKALPADYWTYEIGWWFDACLARLQEEIMSFATGTTTGAKVTTFGDKEARKLCKNQITRDTGNSTVNFSVLAVCIIYGVGVIIVLVSFLMEYLCRICSSQQSLKPEMWKEDDVLHLHRRAFVTAPAWNRLGDENIPWTSRSIPATTKQQVSPHFTI